MDLFKIEQYFKPKKRIEKDNLISHLKELNKFTYSIKQNRIKGSFKNIADLFNLRFSSLLRTEFYFQENQLTEFKITPNFLGNLCLYGFMVATLVSFYNIFSKTEFDYKIGTGIVGLGFLAGIYIVRRILISEIKYVRKKLNIE